MALAHLLIGRVIAQPNVPVLRLDERLLPALPQGERPAEGSYVVVCHFTT